LAASAEPAAEGSSGYRQALRMRGVGELEEARDLAATETGVTEPHAVHLRLRIHYELQDFGALQQEARRIASALTEAEAARLSDDDVATLMHFTEHSCLEDDTFARVLDTVSKRARRDEALRAAWRAGHHRLRFRTGLGENYSGRASIVSLGLNCLPWTLPSYWGFRNEADQRTLFVPFSLGGHTVEGVIRPIAEDFATYCTPETIRIIKTQRGHDLAIRPDRTTHWNHNRGPYWLADGARRLIANLAWRADAFRAACRRSDVVFLLATCPVEYPEEPLDFLPALQAALARHTGTEANRILITNQTNRSAKPGYRRVTDTVAFVNCPYPSRDYVWHDETMADNEEGIRFERAYVTYLLRTLLGWGLYQRTGQAGDADERSVEAA
jgi:hypothetical protein